MLKTNTIKRISAFLLALIMLLGALPLNVFAEAMHGNNDSAIVESDTTNKEKPSSEPKGTDPEKHTISFNPNGGTGNMKSVEVENGKEYSLPKNKFKAPEGKEFKNWLMGGGGDELQEDHKLVVTKDIELKANWKDVKVNPVKKAINSLFGKDNDKLDVSDVNVGDAVSSSNPVEGDPEGTVVSKDGKTRITRFEVKWKDTDELVVEDGFKRWWEDKRHLGYEEKLENWTIEKDDYYNRDIKGYRSNKDIKLDWSISGERTYKPGQIKINLPEIATLKENTAIGYKVDTENTPVPKLIRKDDGSVDVDVDYGKSDYAWEIVDGVFSLVNIKELLPGTTGTSTMSYETSPQGNLRFVNNGSIANIKPNITIDISDDEVIKKEDKTLSIKLNKDINVDVYKTASYYTSWDNSWGDGIKPSNHEDYEYIVYDITSYLYTQYAAGKLNIKDTIGSNQEILGVNISGVLKDGFEKYDKSMNGVFEIDFPVEENEDADKPQKRKNHTIHLLVKVPYKDKGYDKPEKNFSVKYRNDVKVTLTPYDTGISPATATHGVTITRYFKALIPDAKFTAPPGDTYSLSKRSRYGKKHYEETLKVSEHELNDVEFNFIWGVTTSAQLAHLTRDLSITDENNPNGYGKKKYKYVTSDDYLYLNGDYKNELKGEDYSIDKVDFHVSVQDYGLYNNNKSVGYHDIENGEKRDPIPTVMYARENSTGIWTKMATFDFIQSSGNKSKYRNVKTLVNGVVENSGYNPIIDDGVYYYGITFEIPDGYSSVKFETISNNPKINTKMDISAHLKRSKRVLKAIEDSKTDKYPLNVTLRNDATLSVYDEGDNLVAIKGTTERDKNNSRTLDLDKENYGAEMYHDTAYYNIRVDEILKPQILVNIEKSVADFNDYSFVKLKARNNVFEQRFEIPVAIRQTYYTASAQNSNLLYDNYDDKKQGAFYDLLPLGVTSIGNLTLRDDGNINYKYGHIGFGEENYSAPQIRLVNTTDKSTRELDFDYELIPNWRDSGRTMLVVRPKNIEKEKTSNSPAVKISMMLEYTMYYPWESYEDYGENIDRNLVGYEAKNIKSDILSNGYSNPLESKLFKDNEIPYYENIGDKDSKFVYAEDSTAVSGNTIAVTGLHKHVKNAEDPKYLVETKVKEGGSYSYRMRFVSESGTTTRDLILYDSLENYDPLKSNKYYGKKQWKGTLESIDTSQAKLKGADPKVYVSTVENLNIKKNRDLTDTSVWKPYNEGDDLSKVKAVAVDLTKRPDGSKFELTELQSINTILHMRAPDANKDSLDAMALNQVFANNTPIRKKATVENDLIDQANTAVHLETIETETAIKAKKSYLDKEDKAIELKGDDFEFNLKDDKGKTLQTKTNDNKGNITFDPIKYNSWDVGEYTYTIEEVKGKDNKIDYDKHIETVKVNVEKVGDSELKATIVYDKDGSNFTNKEKKSASFQLVKLKSDKKEFGLEEVKDENGNLTSYKVPEAQKDNVLDGAEYKLYKVESDGTETLIDTLITKNGISQVIQNIMPGKYKLKETKAPKGYTLNDKDLIFEITDKEAGTIVAKFATDDNIIDMPSTGGQGTKALMIGGGALVAIMTGVLVVANKKKKEELNK